MSSLDKDLALTIKYDKDYCLQVFAPMNVAFTKGKGVYLYDTEGRKYMDMVGGIAVNSLGHGNRELVRAVQTQAANLIHCCNYYYIPGRSELAYKLCRLSFADKVFFSNSGAEANEAAIKLARGYFYHKGQNRFEIITANMSFHGRTMGTIAATGQEKFSKPFAPNLPGFKYVDYNDIEQLKAAVNDSTAAVMLELIQGESGVHPADREYIKNVRKLCDEKGILLIIDEVQTGVGRTGRMFAYENYGVSPDIMTLAKGLGGGVPIGATLCTNEVATGMKVGDHGSTFGGNPLAMAAGNCVLDQIMDKDLLNNVGQVSGVIFDQLQALKDKYPVITSVRGMGLLIGIEFDGTVSSSGMKEALFSKGFLVSAIGKSTIRIAPPLIISQSEAKKFCKALADILKSQKKRPLQLTAAEGSRNEEAIKEAIVKETGVTISSVDNNELE
ncbi:MAG: aspartate aminotransferase family protein [Saccharofermentans sp.]|nr:aspartate aminotransferase family protein [Saccharofermentans sp.]